MAGPWEKYSGGEQRGVVIADPYREAEERRAQEDQAIQRAQLDLAQSREARQRESERLTREEKSVSLSEKQAEKERRRRIEAEGIRDAISQMRNVIGAAQQAKRMGESGAGIGTWEGSESFRNSDILSILGANQSASDMEALLNTIGSNTAFDRLQRMREESPTGGALGAVSEIELRLLRDSIASLSQRQSEKQFAQNMDKVIAAYQRVMGKLISADRYIQENGSLEGYSPPSEEEIKRIASAPEAAGAGATEASMPIPPEMQAEHAAYLRQNWGALDPQAYADFRASLDRKYGFEPNPEAYRSAVPGLNEAAAQGGTPEGLAIPAVNRDLTDIEQVRNDLVSNDLGAFVATAANAGGFGIPGAMLDEQLGLIREQSPVASFFGDVAGGATGTGIAAGGLAKLAPMLGGRAGTIASNPLAADLTYGGIYGATEADDPVLGALTGLAGAGVGAGLGNLAGRALPRLTGVSPQPDALTRGERVILESVGEQDPVVQALTQAEELGVPMTLADASPELASLAGSATRFSPAVGGQARQVMAQRNQGQLDRLAQAVERDLGPVENIPQRSEDLLAQARAAAAPLYEQAYAAPGAESIPLDDLAERPTFAAALREAYTEVLDEGLDPSAVGLEGVGDDVVLASPSWQALDYAKRGLDNIIERGKRQGDAPAVRRATEMKNALLARMDEANPAYAEARRVYSGPMQERGFMERGQQAIRSSPDQLGVDIASLTPEQRQQMQLGFQSQLMENAGNLRGNSNPWAQLNTPNTEARLGTLYGEGDPVARLLAQRDLELQLAGNANRLIGNSATAERAVADEFFKQQPSLMGDVGQGVAETALLGGPWLTVGKKIGDRIFKERREAAAMEANRALADEVAPLLLETSPRAAIEGLGDITERDAVYQALLADALEQARRRGQHVGAGATTGAITNVTGF
jgi:hypothetical protein